MRDEEYGLNDNKNAYNHKSLKVWQTSTELVIKGYDILKKFPASEKYGLISRMQRCATSVPSNIADGYGRLTSKKLIRFLNIARGFLYELDIQVQISKQLKFMGNKDYQSLSKTIDGTSRMLTGLKKSKTQSLRPQPSTFKPHKP